MLIDPDEIIQHESADCPIFASACPNLAIEDQGITRELLRTPDQLASFGSRIREAVNRVIGGVDLLMDRHDGDTCPSVGGNE